MVASIPNGHALTIMATLRNTLIFLLKWTLVGLAGRERRAAGSPGVSAAPTGSRPVDGSADTAAAVEPAPGDPQRSFADAVARAGPAVVNIYTARVVSSSVATLDGIRCCGRDLPHVRQRVEGSLGSGVIVDERGHLITNHHVIQGAD